MVLVNKLISTAHLLGDKNCSIERQGKELIFEGCKLQREIVKTFEKPICEIATKFRISGIEGMKYLLAGFKAADSKEPFEFEQFTDTRLISLSCIKELTVSEMGINSIIDIENPSIDIVKTEGGAMSYTINAKHINQLEISDETRGININSEGIDNIRFMDYSLPGGKKRRKINVKEYLPMRRRVSTTNIQVKIKAKKIGHIEWPEGVNQIAPDIEINGLKLEQGNYNITKS